MPTTSENRAYAREVGARLRTIRTQQGRSLQQVETLSRGRWKTAAVGSYERGDRMISVEGLAALADFYGVPAHELLPGGRPDPLPPRAARVVLNLPALAGVPDDDASPLRRWVAEIQRERGDYAGRVLSIREGDLRTLATLYTLDRSQLLDRLQQWKVLDPTSATPDLSDTV
ncbi:transcriptional regulator [Frankia sp. CcI156]|uniref:Transcriptional regulator, XRE family n=1 Tax=Frankia casuarinae (strain DSM 45818 / CECT 9043 / HFP020203 / CcI3) TaxID=106370 RepID=Q2JCB9_FRACC|nr:MULTISPECIES: transcriptional regulator [Frankia]ABD11073.1 transcriptional regulator, XRE family [Frankia casuarinae]ESZ99989.1 transcriptional regulator, XRE family [Frankia sp. CcI6]EYT90695.1 transcriptional regulator, XRE family [Frankia casuarinae]KFB05871.1 transcriptional regulator, XRE family [Frankia sp. Allo2]OAA19754.1 putative transcriptional regulator [Frankia casuarinae]